MPLSWYVKRRRGNTDAERNGPKAPDVPDTTPVEIKRPQPDTRETEPTGLTGKPAHPEAGPPEASASPSRRTGLFERLREGLSKTRANLVDRIAKVVAGRTRIDEDLYEDLEEVLLQADVGVSTTQAALEALRKQVSARRVTEPAQVQAILQEILSDYLQGSGGMLRVGERADTPRPHVILVVGVNGAGKTTTIGKLAQRYRGEGKRVVLGAGDTFRAAAIDQLAIWAERTGAELVRHQEGADPAAVAYDAVQAGVARKADLVIIDTAGRLQTKTNLMQELGKVARVVERALGRPADEVLLVIDATNGQNALSQAKLFKEVAPLTGVALTKLDSTAKGGVVISVAREVGVPIKLIGIGERADDLRDFDPQQFVAALFA